MYAPLIPRPAERKPPCTECGYRCQACHCCACCVDCGCFTCTDEACRCAVRPDPLEVLR